MANVVAANAARAPLISEAYREMQHRLHENPGYGVASVHYAPIVAEVARSLGATDLLDHGAGKGRFSSPASTSWNTSSPSCSTTCWMTCSASSSAWVSSPCTPAPR